MSMRLLPASRDHNDPHCYGISYWELRIATPSFVGLAMTVQVRLIRAVS